MERQARIYALLARESSRAVVFRRGPSKRVLLIGWDTDTDQFTIGQWFRGRIYERRCDLSPSGELLLYFAATYREPYFSWSAVTRPPYWTALALWPKGDGWGGGGHFEKENVISLNHRDPEMSLAEGFALPASFVVQPCGDRSGGGEDDPVCSRRMERDGWRFDDQHGETTEHREAKIWIRFEPPLVWTKPHRHSGRYSLEMLTHGIKETEGSWYVLEHRVVPTES